MMTLQQMILRLKTWLGWVPIQPITEIILQPRSKKLFDTADNTHGVHHFRDDILDRLDRYFDVLRRMKISDPDGYALYSKIGAPIGTRAMLLDNPEVQLEFPASWRSHPDKLPIFGGWMILCKPEDEDYMEQCFYYFTKFTKVDPNIEKARPGEVVYQLVAHFMSDHPPKWARKFIKKGGVPLTCYVAVAGESVRALRELHTIRIDLYGTHKRKRINGKRGHRSKNRDGTVTSFQVFDYPNWLKVADALLLDSKNKILTTPDERCSAMMKWIATVNETISSNLQVRATKDGMTALFAVNLLRTPYFFRDRERDIDGSKRRIFHIVRTHQRKSGSYVRSHFRGNREFFWNGYKVQITMPMTHHAVTVLDANFGAHFHNPEHPSQEPMIKSGKFGNIIKELLNGKSPERLLSSKVDLRSSQGSKILRPADGAGDGKDTPSYPAR